MDGSNLFFSPYNFTPFGPSSHSSNAVSNHEPPTLTDSSNFCHSYFADRGRRPYWTPEEDTKLRELVQKYGTKRWGLIARELTVSGHTSTLRNGKSCRSRWMNQLSPDVRKDPFTKDEEKVILDKQREIGNKWAQIARYLPGRTDNAVKNHWNGHLKRKAGRRNSVEREPPSHRENFRPFPAPTIEENYVCASSQHFVENARLGADSSLSPSDNIVVQGVPADAYGNFCGLASQPPTQHMWATPSGGNCVASDTSMVAECLELLGEGASPLAGLVAVTTGAITQALTEGVGWDTATSAKVGAVVGSLTLQGLFQTCPEIETQPFGQGSLCPGVEIPHPTGSRKRFREA